MATNTYVALGTATAAGGATTQLVMSGIPSTYTDLQLVINGVGAGTGGSGGNLWLQFNGDTDGAHYSSTRILGESGTASSGRSTSPGYLMVGDAGSSARFTVIANIMNYANTTTYKTVVSKLGASGTVGAYTGIWRGSTGSATQAITSITFGWNNQNIAAGTTFTLYGIAAEGISGTKATGGVIYSDATYFYHTFAATGAFVPNQNITADVLVVAGGGSGGRYNGGGGGAGGVLAFASQSLTSGTSYTCTVGAGGAPRSGSGPHNGNSGSNSQFASLTASVGGGGAGGGTEAALSGGSGGGAGTAPPANGAAGTTGQGYAGGNSGGSPGYPGGGGGGAGGVGGNATTTVPGNGGAGVNTVTNWGSLSAALTAIGIGLNGYIAGGGGGSAEAGYPLGAAGSGGAGAGAASVGINALVGSGSGGGSTGSGLNTTTTGAGGSGIIIVRYAK